MLIVSTSSTSTKATLQLAAFSLISFASSSREAESSFFESSIPMIRVPGFKITAAAATGPRADSFRPRRRLRRHRGRCPREAFRSEASYEDVVLRTCFRSAACVSKTGWHALPRGCQKARLVRRSPQGVCSRPHSAVAVHRVNIESCCGLGLRLRVRRWNLKSLSGDRRSCREWLIYASGAVHARFCGTGSILSRSANNGVF